MTTPLKSKIRRIQRRAFDWTVQHHPFLNMEQRAEFFARHFDPFLPSGSDILDIGGSWGFYAEPLAKRGHHVTVLDVVKPSYQKAPVVVYDPSNPFPFPDQSFDVSMLITVMHHIPDPESVIREALRVTRKKVIVVEDIYNHQLGKLWTEWRDRFFNFEYVGHPCQFKSAKEWKNLFSALGCQVEHEKHVYTWLSGLRILNGIFIFNR